MNYRLIKHILLLFAIVLFTFGNLIAQSRVDTYLEKARNALSSGDCDAAQIYYENYTSISGKTSSEIAAAIRKCKEDKKTKPAQPQPPKSPTSKPPTANQTGKTNSSEQSGAKQPETNTSSTNGHEWVDLGLPSGTRWATCNVGASSPSEYGSYFAWGETKPKSSYTRDNYMYFSDSNVLPASADAATTNWGRGWRMPTREEMQELIDKCTWTWMSNGYKVTGPNGNGIFLPAAGTRGDSEFLNAGSGGCYWLSLLGNPSKAWYLGFSSDICYMGNNSRHYGHSVRPVCKLDEVIEEIIKSVFP